MYDKLSELIDLAVDRWTSKSPKAAVYVTNIATAVGIVSALIPILPAVFPIAIPTWAITVSSILIAVTAKMTKK